MKLPKSEKSRKMIGYASRSFIAVILMAFLLIILQMPSMLMNPHWTGFNLQRKTNKNSRINL